MLSDIDPSTCHVDDPIRQLETVRSMGDEDYGPAMKGLVAVFDE